MALFDNQTPDLSRLTPEEVQTLQSIFQAAPQPETTNAVNSSHHDTFVQAATGGTSAPTGPTLNFKPTDQYFLQQIPRTDPIGSFWGATQKQAVPTTNYYPVYRQLVGDKAEIPANLPVGPDKQPFMTAELFKQLTGPELSALRINKGMVMEPNPALNDLIREKVKASSEPDAVKNAALTYLSQNPLHTLMDIANFKQVFPERASFYQDVGESSQAGMRTVFNSRTGKYESQSVAPVLSKTRPNLPAETATQIGDFNTLASQLQTVKDTYNSSFVGPINSRTGEVKQLTGLGASPERATFYANVNSIRNQLLYLKSGKQINETEYERLIKELPNERLSSADFKAKLSNFETVFTKLYTNRLKALSQSHFGAVPSVENNQSAPSESPKVDAPTRFKQLKDAGLSKKQAYSLMHQEGY